MERHTLVDGDGFAWDVDVTIPWVWQQGDPESYRESAANYKGDPNPVIILHTPNDPEHYAYGEEGPRFSLSSWSVVALLAKRATEGDS